MNTTIICTEGSTTFDNNNQTLIIKIKVYVNRELVVSEEIRRDLRKTEPLPTRRITENDDIFYHQEEDDTYARRRGVDDDWTLTH